MGDESVFECVIQDVINAMPQQYAPIVIGAMPAENGICCAFAGGVIEKKYLRSTSVRYNMSVVLNAKHESQAMAELALGSLHASLLRMKRFQPNEEYRIIKIQTQNAPSFAGREESGQWLYTSSISVSFSYYGKESII